MESKEAVVRAKHVTFRLLAEEKQRLDEYTRAHEVGISDLMREALAPIINSQAPTGVQASTAVR